MVGRIYTMYIDCAYICDRLDASLYIYRETHTTVAGVEEAVGVINTRAQRAV